MNPPAHNKTVADLAEKLRLQKQVKKLEMQIYIKQREASVLRALISQLATVVAERRARKASDESTHRRALESATAWLKLTKK